MASCSTGASEEGSAVAVRIGIYQGDRLVERSCGHHTEHWPEDFLSVNAHLGGDVGEDRRADEVACSVASHLRVTSIQLQLRAFLDAHGDQAADAI
ncbi:hypothetical protein D9M71_738520 [compost metagenome]